LSAAHARRILHRDIKPANIFLSQVEGYEDLVKILDFGASKRIGSPVDPDEDEVSQEELTNVGFVFGTPYYMAPEQIRSQPLDVRCDIFACGVVLFETLTGERLYRQQVTEDIFREVVGQPARSVRSVKPSLPKEVDEVVRTALRRNPNDRFPTAAAFRKALEKLVRKTPTDVSRLERPRTPHLTSTQENTRAVRLRDLKQQFHEIAEKHRATREAIEGELAARRPDSVAPLPSVISPGDDPEGTSTTEKKSVRRRSMTPSKPKKRSPPRSR
ncbi:MAG: serine/threonine protein kinase, partial [Polyangiaceae bacterium]